MKKQESSSVNSEEQKNDWTKVLFEVIIKILTLGFYHVKKRSKQ